MLEFTDGVKIDTTGELRTRKLKDGTWCVVGQGMFVPADDREDAEQIIRELIAEDKIIQEL